MAEPQPKTSSTLDEEALRIIEDFECAWLRGRPAIPPYVDRHPDRSSRLVIELVAIDLENRIKRGEAVSVAEYAERLPDLVARSDAIAELEDVVRVMRRRVLVRAETPGPVPAVFVETPNPEGPGPAGRAEAVDWIVGRSIGGVRIVRLLNEGGMGRVYEGHQQNPRRTVAVKVIKTDVLSTALLRRFEYEAHVLARLRHPNIAQIYSAGTHESGGRTFPYFVMEHVPGAMPITAYAAAHGLTIPARLELFRKVCDGVGHGHRSGVVHRDLKPGNILVDRAGDPKIIDFGVARMAEGDSTLTSMHTEHGALVGTLQYMSPEQFDADPQAIDARADVYSLGVVVHELLAGRPPFDFKDRSLVEIARIVREEDPSIRSGRLPGVPRDVAVVIGKCLEKQPGRRYGDALALGEDLARHARGEPVTARPPSLGSVVARRLNRHKVVVSLCAGLVALCTSGIGMAVFASRSEKARSDAFIATTESAILRDIESISRDPQFDTASFDHAGSLLGDLTALSPERAEALRVKVRDVFVERLGAAIESATLVPAVRERLVGGLGRLETVDPARATELRTRLAARDQEWVPSLSLESPFEGDLGSIAVERVHVGDGFLRLAEGQAAPVDGVDRFLATPAVLATVAEVGDVRNEVTFGPSWRDARYLGIEFRQDGGGRYLFLLRPVAAPTGPAGADAPPTAEESVAAPWETLIVRDQIILRREVVGPEVSAAPGTLTLSAERRGDRLTLAVPMKELEFLDVFSLPVESPVRMGVALSEGVGLVKWKSFRRGSPSGASPLLEADELYRRARYDDAGRLYAEVAVGTRDTETRREARYKQAIADLKRDEATRAIGLLERLRDEAGDRWALLATAKLLELKARGVRGGVAEKEDLLRVLEIHALESGASLAAVIPEDVRLALVRDLVPDAGVVPASRHGIFAFSAGQLESLKTSYQTLRILDPGSGAYWNVVRSLFLAQLHAGDTDAARQLAVHMRAARVENAGCLTRVMRERGEYAAAFDTLATELADPACDGASAYLVEQLYCLAAMGRWTEWDALAAGFLDRFRPEVETLKRDGLHALGHRAAIGRDYCLVQLMRGFRLEDQGQAEAARAAWADAATRSADRDAPLAGSNRLQDIVRFLTGVSTENDARERAASFVRGNNHPMVSGALLVIPNETIVSVLSRQWSGRRGRFVARATAFDSQPFREAEGLSEYLFFHEYCRQALTDGDFSADEDELVWSLAIDGHAAQTGAGAMPYPLLYSLLLAWRSGQAATWIRSGDEEPGDVPTGGLVIDVQRIPEGIRGRILYLFLMRYRRSQRTEDAERLRALIAEIDPKGIAGRLAARGPDEPSAR